MLNPYFILQSIAIESNVQKHASGGVMENALFFTISKNLQKNTNTGVLNLTKMMAVKRISPNGWFWFLEIYFLTLNCFLEQKTTRML